MSKTLVQHDASPHLSENPYIVFLVDESGLYHELGAYATEQEANDYAKTVLDVDDAATPAPAPAPAPVAPAPTPTPSVSTSTSQEA